MKKKMIWLGDSMILPTYGRVCKGTEIHISAKKAESLERQGLAEFAEPALKTKRKHTKNEESS